MKRTTTKSEDAKPAANLPAALPQPASAYFIEERHDRQERHTLSVLVDNEPGVLARVIGLFSGRGYNIESLTVSETEHAAHVSRITIVTTGTPMVLTQIRHQLERLVPVHSVTDLTRTSRPLERELALVKVAGDGQDRVAALQLADAYEATVVDATAKHFVFQVTGSTTKVDEFVAVMAPLGLVEICRTGVAAIARGAKPSRSR
jgi:acetolactate synthase-1/3 small subunit